MNSPALPMIRFNTKGLPPAQQFEAWREAVGVTHEIASPDRDERDGISASSDVWRLGQMVVSYRQFPALNFARPVRRARVDGLDHHSLLLMREGTWGGDVDGNEVTVGPGEICLFDLARPVDNWVSANASLRVMLPREELDAVLPAGALHGVVLRGGASALLADYLRVLQRRLGDLTIGDAPHVAAATHGMIAACIAPSAERLAAAAPAIAATQLNRARRFIEANLGSAELKPLLLCRVLSLSRSALYRLFEPLGGIAAYIQSRRLLRIRARLGDARDRRRISDLAYAYGFASEAHFSRAFRRAFGTSASEFRDAATVVRAEPNDETAAGGLYRDWARGI